ncbi:MAG: phosphonopyruvate decarboxylase [Gammaproteobacteria bacterium]
MIRAAEFVEAAREAGFADYAGVPCSFLTPFINYVISDGQLRYISSANEGDAVATAAGAAIAGRRACAMMQNSGLGNAVSPLTSLTNVFGIPILLIITQRGAPGVQDEPQHRTMGEITGALLDLMQIKWEAFPAESDRIAPALQRATTYMRDDSLPYAFVMQKDTVAPHPLADAVAIPSRRQVRCLYQDADDDDITLDRRSVLQTVIEHTPEDDCIVIATTGYAGRELFACRDRSNQFYMVGSMGCASSLGLGLALARPDLRVVIIDGDGAALMRMGNIATLGSYGPDNLLHLLLDNGVHDSTGAQATVSSNINFAAIARASGYGMATSGTGLATVQQLFTAEKINGPRFAHLKIKPGTIPDLPRPDVSPQQVLRRMQKHFGF